MSEERLHILKMVEAGQISTEQAMQLLEALDDTDLGEELGSETDTRSERRKFYLSVPLPLTFTSWALRMVRPFVPRFDETGIDEAILALREGLREGNDEAIYIDVGDDDNDEQVTIWLA